MLLDEFEARRLKDSREVIVPKEVFLKKISEITKLSLEELSKCDLGDLEKKLNITASPPNHSLSIKRGKSRSSLYMFIDPTAKARGDRIITEMLKS